MNAAIILIVKRASRMMTSVRKINNLHRFLFSFLQKKKKTVIKCFVAYANFVFFFAQEHFYFVQKDALMSAWIFPQTT